MTVENILQKLIELENPDNATMMARFGITAKKVFGLKIPQLKQLAKQAGKSQALSMELWEINSRETRILATMTGVPESVTEQQMEDWVAEFDSWEICDQCIQCLFEKTPYAIQKALEWCERDEEFVKRAGFVIMARMGLKSKNTDPELLNRFLKIAEQKAGDPRNMVKKGVSWAIRQIGKRDAEFNLKATKIAKKLSVSESKAANWIGKDALKDLENRF